MTIIINPGSGPVSSANAELAAKAMEQFVVDLRERGVGVDNFERSEGEDYGEGRFAFYVNLVGGTSVEIQMPGIPIERVRYLDEDGQNIWDFPRLYVDGSSWVWMFALNVCVPDEDD